MFLTKPTIIQFRHFHQRDQNDQDECSLALTMSAQYFSADKPMEVFQSPQDTVVVEDDPRDTNIQEEELVHEGAGE
jgi:hypothetical protein